MLGVLEEELPSIGRPPKLSRADQLLMTLMYWREYRTQFHIAGSYGISESAVSRAIKKVEDVLIRSDQFHLSGKKVLKSNDKPKHHPLTAEQKEENRTVSSQSIYVEHVIGKLKVFRILSERYRNRRKRFGLRFNLIVAIIEYA